MGITSDRFKDEQADYFEKLGATAVVGPCLRTTRMRPGDQLRQTTAELIASPPDAFVFSTVTGLRHWLALADTWNVRTDLIRALARSRVYPRGAKAMGAAEAAGLTPAEGAGSDRMADTVALVASQGWSDMRVVFCADGSGTAPELVTLREIPARMLVIAPYQWSLPDDRRPALRLAEAVIAGRVHAVTFTSPPAVRNWFTIATEEGVIGPLSQALSGGSVTTGCIGPVTAAEVAMHGIDPSRVVVPDAPKMGLLVRAIRDHLTERVIRTSETDGPEGIVLSGTVAMIAGESFVLSPGEARLLAALARDPYAVHSAEELLLSVWQGAAQDPHLVEVLVARLRRRLGDHGDTIASVHRRGYALRL